MVDLADRRLLFVSGKGGVGKTSVAAAIAIHLADSGLETLLCEVDTRGDLSSYLECGRLAFEEREVHPGLWVMTMDPEASLREYLKLNLRIPVMGRIGPLSKAFEFLATAAPGVREILTVGKVCHEVRRERFDVVVVDAPASGHVVGYLAAPQAINDLVKVGMIRSQTDWMLEILSDPARTGLVIVAIPEEMPVTEAVDLAERAKGETTVDLASVIVNRMLPEVYDAEQVAMLGSLSGPDLETEMRDAVGGEVRGVMEAAHLAISLRSTAESHVARLRDGIDPDVPVISLPYLFTRSHSMRAIKQLARHLADELSP